MNKRELLKALEPYADDTLIYGHDDESGDNYEIDIVEAQSWTESEYVHTDTAPGKLENIRTTQRTVVMKSGVVVR